MIGRKLTERLARTAAGRARPARRRAAFEGSSRRRVRSLGARRSRKAGRRAPGPHLPPRRDRLRRGGGRFRQGLPHQPRRHAAAVRGDPQGRRRLQAAAWSSPRRSPCSARRFPERSATSSSTRRSPATARRRRSASCCSPTTRRRGFFDGIGIRLPTICVRPGKPNKAASGFFSGIIREPLAGQEAVLPVPETVRHWFASPRAAVGFLLHAATHRHCDSSARGATSPCRACRRTVGEQIEALRKVAGDKAARLHPPRARPDRSCASSPAGRGTSTPRRALGARLPRRRELRGDHPHPHRRTSSQRTPRTSASSRVRFIGGRLCRIRRP